MTGVQTCALPIYLFVPGDRPERFGKALAAGAEAVIDYRREDIAARNERWSVTPGCRTCSVTESSTT